MFPRVVCARRFLIFSDGWVALLGLQSRQVPPRRRRELNPYPISDRDHAVLNNYTKHAASKARSSGLCSNHRSLQALLKSINKSARGPQARNFNNRRWSEMEAATKWQSAQLKARCRYVFTELAGPHHKSGLGNFFK